MHPRNSVVYIVCIHAYYIVGLRETKKNRIQGGGDRFSVHFAYTDMPDVCLSFVLLFAIFIIVDTQKLVLQQSKNVTAKCTENISPLLEFYISLRETNHCMYTYILNSQPTRN